MTRLKVMTYNIRSCLVRGLKHDPMRIAKVIQSFNPDIIALQEVDVGYKFKGGIDQAREIARLLEMDVHFHPSVSMEEGGYGNAILSKFPMEKIKAAPLPRIETPVHLSFLESFLKVTFEPRGVLWVEVLV
ncbi:MAG: endonuclease/exonuclease/phosphatase family protein, partial [Candidatus Omnitrophica bacterium]|nr:endonuclease/exonuclease/phosphatase family protein [Candidatus Omnitrophota bacterium]